LAHMLNRQQLDSIETILEKDLIDQGVHCVLLIDMAGNIIADHTSGQEEHDIYSLAALAAGNFGAVNAMAKVIGEDEFSLLFHKGEKESIHFTKVTDDYLLLVIFDKEISLGFLRLKVDNAVVKIKEIFRS